MYNILVIDDHPFTLKILKQILEKQKYGVDHFTNPLQALNFLNQSGTKIDLIISDVMMEQMSGLELLAKIKQNPKLSFIPFIVISASMDTELRQQAFQLGAVDYIEKPIQSNIFISKINSLLSNLALTHLSKSIILQGNKETLKPDEILSFCQAERVNGFVYISNGIIELEFIFKSGQPDMQENLSERFEQLRALKHYEFIIAHGKLQPDAARRFLKQTTHDIRFNALNESDYKSLFERYDDLEDIFIFKNKWQSIKNDQSSDVPSLLHCLSETSDSLSALEGNEPKYLRIGLSDKQQLLIIKYNNHPLAFNFNSKEGFDNLLKIWLGTEPV